MSLSGLMDTELPLNRKERFFTGTVFPMLVCRDNFRHFHHFTSLIPGYEPQHVDPNPDTANIQFFSEYSLVESISDSSRARFPNPPRAKDTPDVVILIKDARKVLIALEAKMYDVPTRTEMLVQLRHQRELLRFIQAKLQIGDDSVYHFALLPEQLANELGHLGVPTITWQRLHETYREVFGDEDYFLALLGLSLESYDKLVSHRVSFGNNSEATIPGEGLYTAFRAGTLTYTVMGRSLGLHGELLRDDLASGRWRSQEYEVSSALTPPNRNWFLISQFLDLVDGQTVR